MRLLWALFVGLLSMALCGIAAAQGISAQGRFDAGPTPSQVDATKTTDFKMSVRNNGAGTYFEVRVSAVPGGITVTSKSGRQFIAGSQKKDFTLSINPDLSAGDQRITLQLWGDSEAGDVELIQTQQITIASINPPGAFLITYPDYGQVLGQGPFTLNWSTSSNATSYDLYIYKMLNGSRVQPPVLTQETLVANAYSLLGSDFEKGALYQVEMYAKNAVARRIVTNTSHQFRIEAAPTPGFFQITAPTNGTLTTPTPQITWSASENALTYTLYILKEVDGLPEAAPTLTYEGITTTSFTVPAPGLIAGQNYYASVRAVAEGGERLNDNLQVRFQVAPADAALSPVWYFAEGASYDFLDTYYLIANPNEESIQVDVTFLVEAGDNRTVSFGVPSRSRQTIRVNDWVSNVGVSGVLREVNGKPFAAERAMYSIGASRRWYGATAVTGIIAPAPEWFLAEGATSSAGNGNFQTFVLVANPNDIAVPLEVTFYPQGDLPITIPFTVGANRRLTIDPSQLGYAALNKASFSTRVRATDGSGVLVERAMWWFNADWASDAFAEGNASPGIPTLSRSWYLGEGNTVDYDEFILLVNPHDYAVTVDLRYLIATAEPADRRFTLDANSRFTINVRYDEMGLGAANTHGTMIVASNPIAVERSLYFNLEGGSGWVGGTSAIASAAAASQWIFPEGAEFPFEETELTTQLLVANPNPENATLTFDFLKADGTTFQVTKSLQGFRRMTLESDDFPELYSTAFSTTLTSTVPVVAERTMVFGTNTPRRVTRIGATGSMGIPVGPLQIHTSLPLTATKSDSVISGLGTALPTPTPTPIPSPTPAIR